MTANYSVKNMNEIRFSTTDLGTIKIGDNKHSFLNQYCRIKATPKDFTSQERNVRIEEFKRLPSRTNFPIILQLEGTKVIDDIQWKYRNVDHQLKASFIIGSDDIRAIYGPSIQGDLLFDVENTHGIVLKLKQGQRGGSQLYIYLAQN